MDREVIAQEIYYVKNGNIGSESFEYDLDLTVDFLEQSMDDFLEQHPYISEDAYYNTLSLFREGKSSFLADLMRQAENRLLEDRDSEVDYITLVMDSDEFPLYQFDQDSASNLKSRIETIASQCLHHDEYDDYVDECQACAC